jgi:hypothetical protein
VWPASDRLWRWKTGWCETAVSPGANVSLLSCHVGAALRNLLDRADLALVGMASFAVLYLPFVAVFSAYGKGSTVCTISVRPLSALALQMAQSECSDTFGAVYTVVVIIVVAVVGAVLAYKLQDVVDGYGSRVMPRAAQTVLAPTSPIAVSRRSFVTRLSVPLWAASFGSS